jgi:predicted lipoprotein
MSCVVPLGDGKRRVVAGELTREVILPTYEDVVTTVAALKTATHAFADAPAQDTLDAVQAAWRAARSPWKLTDAFRFGPQSLQSLGAAIDQFPVDPPKIEPEIAGTAVLDAAYFANIGANKKGFHGIEYLIFSPDDAVVLAAFTTEPNADRRRAFVAGCADHLAASTVKLRDAWLDYAALLAAPGADNADYPTIKASIDALVNESVFQAEVVADARIGKPMGTASGGTPHPELQESAPSGHSVEDMTRALESIRNIYFGSRDGTPGKGIGALVVELSPVTDRDVRESLATAFAALAAIPMPYTQALLDARPEVMAAYTAVQDLQHVLATEVIATLGATLKFNDNDGD